MGRKRSPWPLALALALLAPAGARAQAAGELSKLLATVPADSLPASLRRFETSRAAPAEGAQAAFLLGQLHFARGEYRDAAAAFARAAARLDPARKPEARYRAGLAWLGYGDPTQALAAFEDVARVSETLAAEAALGMALAWELERRPERALGAIAPLLEAPLGESGPAILERAAALAERLQRHEQAQQARGRLLRDYPRSMEAASARAIVLASAQRPGGGSLAVVIGSFLDLGRARSLAAEARRAGFSGAQVVTRGEGLAAVHVVRLGVYGDLQEARTVAEQATSALGVVCEIARSP